MNNREYNIVSNGSYAGKKDDVKPVSSYYGEDTFNQKVMQQKLPKNVYDNFTDIINTGKKLDLETANAVAHAMKEWAIEKGATHYSHWFQPMTSLTAEKHDSFIEILDNGEPLERFSGKQLVQGEPDASSFPSGGIRSTFEARGYTVWDPSSPAFILRRGKGTTLFIPSVFLSYTGEALDNKTPLLRSIHAINESSLRVLKALGNRRAKKVFSTLGPEQEYFLIDREMYNHRQDLVLTGRTLIGAPPAKGQQLEDHYFGTIRERILSYMHEVEEELYRLGIPAKTRHNEVAPSQYEIAPIFEEANIAVDHNQILMQTMKKIAARNDLVCLLHEKPFAEVNGSGKHLNWSLSDDAGSNLLNPGSTPHDNIQFLVFLIATVRAVYLHGDLLRASVASSANDHRLGANEAPPAIISVFLGEQLTRILNDIESGAITEATNAAIIDLGISRLPVLSKDNTDRNRTSPFAFTGNKFEFRAVGSRQSISLPATVLNAIVAESLDYLASRIEERKSGDIKQSVLDILREEIKIIKPVVFNGDNYSKEWEQEAAKRGLPNKKNLPASITDLISGKALSLFEKYSVLSNVEMKSRFYIRVERYCKKLHIEAATLSNLVNNHVLPYAFEYQGELATSIANTADVLGEKAIEPQKKLLGDLTDLINGLLAAEENLKDALEKAHREGDELREAEYLCNEVKPLMGSIRVFCDRLETLVPDEIWTLPKFWEMLFLS
jgi:glutamine synthetase